jgi:hypothetical protein
LGKVQSPESATVTFYIEVPSKKARERSNSGNLQNSRLGILGDERAQQPRSHGRIS